MRLKGFDEMLWTELKVGIGDLDWLLANFFQIFTWRNYFNDMLTILYDIFFAF
jgi:hypothetical protein